MAEQWNMTLTTAVQILVDCASRWGENAEEEYTRRIKTSDSIPDLEKLLTEGDRDFLLNQAIEIRDLWRAIEVAQREINKPIEAAPR